MRYSCLHTHTDFCDGHADVETMCRVAFERGFVSIGFSSHAPIPGVATEWHLKRERLEEYAGEVLAARRRWEGKIAVYLGLEVDYIHGYCGPADNEFASLDLDFIIASVHYLAPRNGSPLFTVDGPEKELENGIRDGYDGDGDALTKDYWNAVASMIRAGGFDIVGHLDLVKKNNLGNKHFDMDGEVYHSQAQAAIDQLQGSAAVVEVNTGGLNRGSTSEVYPAGWMLKALRERGVRTMINADAHRPEHLGGYYEEARRSLVSAGFSETSLFAGRTTNGSARWIDEPL